MVQGNFFAQPRRVELKEPSIVWHWAKVAFEKYWLWKMY
jgi:hypothetical protein